jgi:Domain of unknown function (DUF4440)
MRARFTFLLMVMVVCSLSAQQPATPPAGGAQSKRVMPAGVGGAPMGVPAPSAADEVKIKEVMAFEKACDDAAVRGDVAFVNHAVSSDFIMTHGDAWITGGSPINVDTKETWLKAVQRKPYVYRRLDHVQVELHGDIALTIGRYYMASSATPRSSSYVWFERLYAKRNSEWQFLSHRTVNGPIKDKDNSKTSGQ